MAQSPKAPGSNGDASVATIVDALSSTRGRSRSRRYGCAGAQYDKNVIALHVVAGERMPWENWA